MTPAPILVAASAAVLLLRIPRPRPRTPVAAPAAATTVAPPGGDRERCRRRPVSRRVLLVVLAGVAVASVGPVLTGAACATVPLVRRWNVQRGVARRRRDAEAVLPDLVELIVMTVHAGHSPAVAIVEARRSAPAAALPALDAVALRLRRGQALADALGALVDHFGPPAHAVVDAIAAGDRYGLPVATILDRLAVDARAARRRAGEADARSLPVRLAFPLVACTLPAFVLLAIAPVALATLSSLRDVAP